MTTKTAPSVSLDAPSDVLTQLRARTRDLHTQAERHPVQAALVRGVAGSGLYVEYLQQLRHIHLALEAQLGARAADPLLRPVHSGQFRAGHAEADLAALGAGTDSDPVPPVADFCAAVPDLATATLLGMHYVLEGSTNGGRFIAKAVRRGLPSESSAATRYLDPYGDEQGARWGEFCGGLSALPLGAEELASVVSGAEAMFRLIIDMFEAMASPRPA